MSNPLPKAFFVAVWIAAVVGALAIAAQFTSATQFFGIADDQEQHIRFAEAVEIIELYFVAGEEVAKDEVVLQVRQPSLEAELAFVEERLAGLYFSEKENSRTLAADIVQLKQDMRTELSRVDTLLKNLSSRRETTRALLQTNQTTNFATIDREIASLKVQRDALRRSTAAQIESLQGQLTIGARPIDAEIAELNQRKLELLRQQEALAVTANMAGRVGSVLFKVGDTVPPYQPIVTVHSARPTFIKGYIHENVSNDIRKNAQVWVTSLNQGQSTTYRGVVESLGARIVEFPVRLKVNPLAQAWGREVVVRLEGPHDLLLGEKVTVQAEGPNPLIGEFHKKFTTLKSVASIEAVR